MNHLLRRLSGLCFVALFGCQTPPTTIFESDVSQSERAFKGVSFGKVESKALKKAVIVDARSRFEFDMARTPRSFHYTPADWDLFSYKGKNFEKRKRSLQRRLALKGVDPYVAVIVVGKGLQGKGEEYHAAAVLYALGLPEITVTSVKELTKAMISGLRVESIANTPYWERPVKHNFSCAGKNSTSTVMVPKPKVLNNEVDITGLISKIQKNKTTTLDSGAHFFAYGAAMSLLRRNYKACVK